MKYGQVEYIFGVQQTVGKNWTIKNHWTGSYGLPFVHADIHFLEYDRKSLDLYCANDGGIYKTTNQGNSWIDLSDGIGIMQFYKISTSKQNSDLILGGSQDNGTNIQKNGKWISKQTDLRP